MAVQNHVENPFEYVLERLAWTWSDIGRAVRTPVRPHARQAALAVRRIGTADLAEALRRGAADLGATRDDVVFLALFYPLAGLVLAGLAFHENMLPLIFPLVAGFAILGPLAAVGLYEVSRRREAGEEVTWRDGFQVLRSPALGSIMGLGAMLVLLFLGWITAAWAIHAATLGRAAPHSLGGFAHQVLATPSGWAMAVIGIAVGAIFAVLAFALSVVSFPLLLDRDVGMDAAIATSFKAIRTNPGTMTLWGVIVAGALALGSAPALVGLIFVVPLLGHATWHLYRKVVAE